MIETIVGSKIHKIRFTGSDYYNDKPITDAEIKAMKSVLKVFKGLGGKIN